MLVNFHYFLNLYLIMSVTAYILILIFISNRVPGCCQNNVFKNKTMLFELFEFITFRPVSAFKHLMLIQNAKYYIPL